MSLCADELISGSLDNPGSVFRKISVSNKKCLPPVPKQLLFADKEKRRSHFLKETAAALWACPNNSVAKVFLTLF